jgi:hypothetical protein
MVAMWGWFLLDSEFEFEWLALLGLVFLALLEVALGIANCGRMGTEYPFAMCPTLGLLAEFGRQSLFWCTHD